jgi:hypothetical protein
MVNPRSAGQLLLLLRRLQFELLLFGSRKFSTLARREGMVKQESVMLKLTIRNSGETDESSSSIGSHCNAAGSGSNFLVLMLVLMLIFLFLAEEEGVAGWEEVVLLVLFPHRFVLALAKPTTESLVGFQVCWEMGVKGRALFATLWTAEDSRLLLL